MKIASYFNVNGIKVSEPKKESDLGTIQFLTVSPKDQEFIDFIIENQKKMEQYINDALCIPRDRC